MATVARGPALRMVQAIAKRLPKIELHCHLDGSVAPALIAASAARRGVELPCAADELSVFARRRDRSSMQRSLSIFDWVNQFLQTEEELEAAAESVVAQLRDDGVVHAEIRFCPELHTHEGLSPAHVVRAVKRGIERVAVLHSAVAPRARAPTGRAEDDAPAGADASAAAGAGAAAGAADASTAPVGTIGSTPKLSAAEPTEEAIKRRMSAALIITALRSLPSSHSVAMARLAVEEQTAFDLAGDEQRFPLAVHEDALALCKASGVPMTLHAGEWPGSIANVLYALEAGAVRIGHGIVLHEDEALMRRVKDKNVHVECCMTANVGGKKARDFATHPVQRYLAAGISASLNSDNLLVSGSVETGPATSTGEVVRAVEDVGLSWGQVTTLLSNACDAAFIDEAARAELKTCVLTGANSVLASEGLLVEPAA